MGCKADSVYLSAFFLCTEVLIVLNVSPLMAGNSLTNAHILNSAHTKHDMPRTYNKLAEA